MNNRGRQRTGAKCRYAYREREKERERKKERDYYSFNYSDFHARFTFSNIIETHGVRIVKSICAISVSVEQESDSYFGGGGVKP